MRIIIIVVTIFFCWHRTPGRDRLWEYRRVRVSCVLGFAAALFCRTVACLYWRSAMANERRFFEKGTVDWTAGMKLSIRFAGGAISICL